MLQHKRLALYKFVMVYKNHQRALSL